MPINKKDLVSLKKYVRVTNYLSVAQIYLRDNVFLNRPLEFNDIKPRLLGHWGTCPWINFVQANINRLIIKHDVDFNYIVGPGHGFPAIQSNLFLEKSLTIYYPEKIPYTEDWVKEITTNFSAPYGYPSHSNPAAPGAILEGGELGYSLSIAFGSVLDNPDLISVCLVWDGESETGPLSAAWHVNKFLDPKDSGAVLPIIHLNGYKISWPTVLWRMNNKEIKKLYSGYGYHTIIVDENDERELCPDIYEEMAEAMDEAYSRIRAIQAKVRIGKDVEKPKWPMIVLRTKKGWTGVKEDQGKKLEGNCLSHQVIIGDVKKNEEHLKMLEEWLKSYKFDELFSVSKNWEMVFDEDIQYLIPKKGMACGCQPLSYGGEIVEKIKYPELRKLSYDIKNPGKIEASSMWKAGDFMKEVFERNENIRLFSPDETYSNKLGRVFEVTKRSWQWPLKDFDTDFGRQWKVIEMLSEHTLFGLAHGYTVTGRHWFFVSYEAFVQVIASMADQYAKFIKASQPVHFRKPVPALNVILTSLLERQDHNGFSHQNPSFIASMLEKDENIISAYLPPDANTMLLIMKKCLDSRDSLNLIVAGKKDLPQWLSYIEAEKQVKDWIMTWDFISDKKPDIVLVASGDYVTKESIESIKILKSFLPKVKIRFVNVSELTSLWIGDKDTALNEKYLDQFLTKDKWVVFNFHGYPNTIKKLLFDYSGANRVKVNGYIENGSTTTPFDMEVRNWTSRYHLVKDMSDKLYNQDDISEREYIDINNAINEKLKEHKEYILEHGEDPEFN